MCRFTVLLGVVLSAYGQTQPAPTRIGKHHLGETIEEWLAANDLKTLDDVCQVRRKEVRAACEQISGIIRSPGGGGYDPCALNVDDSGQKCDEEIADVQSGKEGAAIVSAHGKRYEEWTFANKRLAKYLITIRDSNTPREIRLLTDAYGLPTATKTIVYQNSYGLRWDCPELQWVMPDGALLLLEEFVNNTDYGPNKGVRIHFISQDQIRSEEKKAKANPYK